MGAGWRVAAALRGCAESATATLGDARDAAGIAADAANEAGLR